MCCSEGMYWTNNLRRHLSRRSSSWPFLPVFRLVRRRSRTRNNADQIDKVRLLIAVRLLVEAQMVIIPVQTSNQQDATSSGTPLTAPVLPLMPVRMTTPLTLSQCPPCRDTPPMSASPLTEQTRATQKTCHSIHVCGIVASRVATNTLLRWTVRSLEV